MYWQCDLMSMLTLELLLRGADTELLLSCVSGESESLMQLIRKLSEKVCPDFLILKVASLRLVLDTMLQIIGLCN